MCATLMYICDHVSAQQTLNYETVEIAITFIIVRGKKVQNSND